MQNAGSADADQLTEFERRFSPAGLMTRYARGRVNHFVSRQVVTMVGGLLLFIVNGPLIGSAAIAIALCGEAIDCFYLNRVPRQLARGASLSAIRQVSTVTALVQALTIAVCVCLAWFGPVSHGSPLFSIAFLAGAAINAGLVAPFHPGAAAVRMSVYAVTAVGLMLSKPLAYDTHDSAFILDAGGTLMLAYMVHSFLSFGSAGFLRHRQNTLALLEQRRALELANREMIQRQKEAQQLSLVARNANDSVVLSDGEGRIFWINDAFTKITGYSPHEALGRTPAELLNGPDTDPQTTRAIARAVSAGRPFRGEILNLTKDGRPIWIETNLFPVLDDSGAVELIAAIERDTTEAKEHARELEQARRAAEDGARAKAEFLATMSHEIRTPMNGVIGMADLLVETDLSDEQKEYTETIRSSAQALLTIINDILDLSKMDAQKMALNPVAFDLPTCLTAAVQLLQPQARDKGLNLSLDLGDGLPERVWGDDGRLRQVLINLIGNAVKFTDTGHVAVRADAVCQRDGYLLTIHVEDTGIGIAPDKTTNVFERFSQADAATTRRFGGTGLGLTISRMLIDAMSGTISLRSQPGQGSCFTVELALPACAGPTRPDAQKTSGSTPPPSHFEGLRVLVAEDNRVNRVLMRKYFKDVPVELHFAEDGQQAVEMNDSARPDVIFMDMSMPVMNGLDATREIRAKGDVQPVIIALTANAFASDEAACRQAGMDAFLSKPVRRADLLCCLDRHRPADTRCASG